jgi:hypothetical protein
MRILSPGASSQGLFVKIWKFLGCENLPLKTTRSGNLRCQLLKNPVFVKIESNRLWEVISEFWQLQSCITTPKVYTGIIPRGKPLICLPPCANTSPGLFRRKASKIVTDAFGKGNGKRGKVCYLCPSMEILVRDSCICFYFISVCLYSVIYALFPLFTPVNGKNENLIYFLCTKSIKINIFPSLGRLWCSVFVWTTETQEIRKTKAGVMNSQK